MRLAAYRLALLAIILGMPAWLFVRGMHNAANAPRPDAFIWLPADMCGPPQQADVQHAGFSDGLSFFTGGDSYMPRTRCMVTATGETDWLWVGLLLVFNLTVIVGYLRIFWFWRRAYLAEEERDRNTKLMDLAWIFLFCAVCGYVSSIVLFFWPAYRLLAIMLVPLGFFTWRFAYNLEPFRVALGAKRFQRELREELENRNQELERLVEDATAKLREAVDEANRAKEIKSRFLANMSHEIRTPMTAIVGFCDIIAAEGELDEASRQHLGVVRSNGSHLLGVINNILDQSKLESGKLSIQNIDTDVRTVVAEVVESIAPSAAERGNTLTDRISDGVPERVSTDPVRLRQILFNLVANANKFTQGGSVTLDVQPGEQGTLVIEVTDTGVGMDSTQIARCFEAFTQADPSTTRVFGGTGLGLSIAREVARAMGGDIAVESTPGKGSRFRATIACRPASAAGKTGSITDQRVRQRPALPGLADNIKAAKACQVLRGKTVCVIDDSEDNRRLISFWLERAGAIVKTACDGREGATLVTARHRAGAPPDLVLMDLHMPGVGGAEAASLIRREGIGVPIVVLSADVMPEARRIAGAAGCDAFADKPVNFPELFALIERVLDERAHRLSA